MRRIRSFLEYARFYRRFIKDFSKVARPLCKLLEKGSTTFSFDEECMKAFEEIKARLIYAPIVIVPDWDEPFEIMFATSD